MKVTRDVVLDLFPIYQAGEASSDTRTLVEQFLADDPEFARIVQKAAGKEQVQSPSLPPELELQALERTRTVLRHRSFLLAFALFFTLLPMSFVAGSRLVWSMWRDAPSMVVFCWVVAAGLWVAYLLHNRRLRQTAL